MVRDSVTGETKTIKVRDGHAIQMANAKIEEIRQGFVDWLGRTPDTFKQQLSDRYNRLFNCFVRPNFDGEHQTFPDLDLKRLGIADLYKSQKDAVWMLKTNGGGICDHEVGAGKTLIMCTAAYEMKRLGLANKPMIIGLKANVFDIADTFRKAYPNARLLYPGKNDFTKQNRQRIFNDIKNNDWDCIILTHEQFGMIPQALEIQEAILQKEMDSVEENLEVLRKQGKDISVAMLKGLEKRKQTLDAKLKEIRDSIAERKDDAVDFKMMGIDHLFVDESHQYKNLISTPDTTECRVWAIPTAHSVHSICSLPFAPYRSGRARTWGRRSCRERPSVTRLQSCISFSNICVRRLLRSRASTASMHGQRSLRRSPPIMSFPSRMTSFKRNGSEPSSRCRNWRRSMRKYGSRKQKMA